MLGIGASPGFAAGRVFIKRKFQDPIETVVRDCNSEINRFKEACRALNEKLVALEKRTLETMGSEESQIFKAHQMMLMDPELTGKIETLIKNQAYEAAYAVTIVRDEMVTLFESLDNDYMKERAADIKDVCNGLIKILLGIKEMALDKEDQVIIVAEDLTPSDTASIDKDKVAGFITAIGGKTSHTAIMSRTLGMPAIVGMTKILDLVKDDDFIIFDGESGELVINPDPKAILNHREKSLAYDREKSVLRTLIGQKSISKDGHQVELACNIGQPDDMASVLDNDGEAIGLFRSEFLYMNRDKMPSEEEQYQAYKAVLEAMAGPVVIRTLDVGGDKHLPYLDFPQEENPFLGYRAIRYCLDHPEVFKTQIRALLRASVHGNLKIMFPMISSLEELRRAKAVVNEVKADLDQVGDYEIGMMIEIPAAAVISDILAKEVDFFSIGTNDLIQYTNAVDRMNETISDLYTPYHPAVLRLIKTVIENGHKAGIWVGMCGEVAGNQHLIPILFAMGLDEFSMSPSSVLKSRHLIRSLDKETSKTYLNDIWTMSTAEEIEAYLKAIKYHT